MLTSERTASETRSIYERSPPLALSGTLDEVDVARGLVNVLELAERGASEGGRALDRVQVRLHSWRLALDPQTREWVEAIRQGVADGSLDDQALDRQDLSGMIKAVRSRAT